MTDVRVLEGAELKEGDTDPDLSVKLLQDGTDKDLTGFTATLRVRHALTDEIIVDSAMTVESARDGIVEYSWSESETADPGVYEAEVSIDDGSGTVMTFPNGSMFNIYIHEIIQ